MTIDDIDTGDIPPPLVISDGETARRLCDHVRGVRDALTPLIAQIMTPERAAFVRRSRIDDENTWRGVAQECFDEWGGIIPGWSDIPSNQLIGIYLCEQAAAFLGEDPNKDPWN